MNTKDALPTVIAIYRVRPGKEEEFQRVLQRHHPMLRRLDLVTDDPPVYYCGTEDDGGPIMFEIFSWKNKDTSDIAHKSPEVMEVWGEMGKLVEERDGRPRFEFPHVTRLDLPGTEG